MRRRRSNQNDLARADWKRGAALCAGLVIGALLATSPLLADTIEMVNGQKQDDVQIVLAHWDSIQFKKGAAGRAQTMVGQQVLSITRASDFLTPARSAIESGDYERAARALGNVAGAGADWEKAEAMYLQGLALQLQGNVKEAEKAYKAYLEKYKGEKDWWVPHATLGLGEMLLGARQPGTAEVYFRDLAQYGGPWELRSKLGLGEAILLGKGKGGAMEARKMFDEVRNSASAPAVLKQKAAVGRAKAFLLQDQADQLIKEVKDTFFDSPKPEDLLYTAQRAEATLLLGRGYMALGGKENLEQAEMWLLRVPALYGKHVAAFEDACDLLAEVYDKLGNKARAEEWRARKAGGGKAASAEPSPAPEPKEAKSPPAPPAGKSAKNGKTAKTK